MKFDDKNDAALIERHALSEEIFDGVVLHVFKDMVTLPNGHSAVREVIRHVGAVCVVPLTDKDEVICVRQYRYPAAQVMLEIPAGKLDSKQEDRREAALRELREETGVSCAKLTSLGAFYPAPAYSDELIDMYLAEDLTQGETDFDEDEFLAPVRIPLKDLVDDVMAGRIPDVKTQAAALRVWELLRRRADEKGDLTTC